MANSMKLALFLGVAVVGASAAEPVKSQLPEGKKFNRSCRCSRQEEKWGKLAAPEISVDCFCPLA